MQAMASPRPFRDMRKSGFWFLIGTALAIAGCGQGDQSRQVTFQQKVLPHPNSTSYEYGATVQQVKSAINRAFCQWKDEELAVRARRVWNGPGDIEAKHRLTMALQLPPGSLFLNKEDAYGPAEAVLGRPGNENDAYFNGTESPVDESPVYFADGHRLIYYADFHIHVAAVGAKRTRVEVFTRGSSVVVGAERGWTVHGPNTSFIMADVKPTTVEEYQILLRIGQQLGEKDMPPLITPGTNSPIGEVTKPRKS
jgi:hypothetical protein